MAPRILIAEDNDQIAAALEALLRRQGMATDRARDGLEALNRIAAGPPDLLLLDLKLPHLHGIELLKNLRQNPRTRNLPVVISTGAYKGERYAQAARRLGVTAYLEKPFRAEALLAALRQALPATGAQKATMDRHLHRAFTGRFSGRYTLRCAGGDKSLLFLNGSPVSLRPGFVHRDFGDYLHRKGTISTEEYAYYRGDGGHRHETLVQMGCLEYPELLQEKLAYLTEELVAAFGQGPLAVEEAPFAGPPGLQLITVNVPRIFHQGFRRHPQLPGGRRLVTEYGRRYVALAEGYFRYINFLTLADEEKRLLGRLDGSRTLADCLEGEEDLIPLLHTLQALGMVRLAEAPLDPARAEGFPLRTLFNAVAEEASASDEPLESFADLVEETGLLAPLPTGAPEAPSVSAPAGPIQQTLAELQGKDYYEIFDMSQGNFSFDRLKKRYFAFTREYGPETLMQLTGEEAGLVEEILATVTTAYNTLSDVVKKERYDELLGSDKVGLGQKGDDRFQAQVQFQSGKVFIEMEEWDSAERALQDACNIDPNSGDYLAHLAWAIYRNPKNERSQAMGDKARLLLNRALALERTPQGYAFKGWMLLDGGQAALAEAEFNKALKLDAQQKMARQGLRAIQEKREQEKKGLFRRMFG